MYECFLSQRRTAIQNGFNNIIIILLCIYMICEVDPRKVQSSSLIPLDHTSCFLYLLVLTVVSYLHYFVFDLVSWQPAREQVSGSNNIVYRLIFFIWHFIRFCKTSHIIGPVADSSICMYDWVRNKNDYKFYKMHDGVLIKNYNSAIAASSPWVDMYSCKEWLALIRRFYNIL